MRVSRIVFSLSAAALTLTACGSDGTATVDVADAAQPAPAADASAGGLRLVSADAAQATLQNPPDDLVILDVRTPEEFAEGHIDGAIMLDFYEPDFAEGLADLDPDVPYVLYCRSGNRSGQTLAMMEALGFQNVQDVNGGVTAWAGAGLPLVAD